MNDNTPFNEDKINKRNPKLIKDYEEFFNQNRLRILPPNNPNISLKSLAAPRFLGSYHIKQASDPRFNTLSNIMKGNLEIKYAKALRNSVLNPVTIALIIVAVVFNLLWFFII